MTPKEKAIELVKKFLNIEDTQARYGGNLMFSEEARQCAIIAVDEIIDILYKLSDCSSLVVAERDFYEEVKQELLTL